MKSNSDSKSRVPEFINLFIVAIKVIFASLLNCKNLLNIFGFKNSILFIIKNKCESSFLQDNLKVFHKFATFEFNITSKSILILEKQFKSFNSENINS